MALVKSENDYGKILTEYNVVNDRLPVVGDLVYVVHGGVYTVEETFNSGDIDVDKGEVIGRIPTNHYRLIERKESDYITRLFDDLLAKYERAQISATRGEYDSLIKEDVERIRKDFYDNYKRR